MKPIKTEQESARVQEYLVSTAMSTLGIDRTQATKRIKALMRSDVLKNGNPNDINTQRAIDKFMTTPI